jgi:molybdenum cofactor cytidylyltransferase
METPKPLLPFGDRTILTATMDAVQRSGTCFETIVVLGDAAEEIRPLVGGGARVVVNAEPAEGLASSIRVAVASASPDAEAYMLLLGDHPLLRAETVRRLVDAFATSRHGIGVPVHQGVIGHPVLFDRRYREALMALSGDEGARSILLANPSDVVDVHVGEVGVIFDVDDEEDYDEALRIAGLPPRPVAEPDSESDSQGHPSPGGDAAPE